MRKILLVCLITGLFPPCLYAEEEFVLGLWHCWNTNCVGGNGNLNSCCPDQLWGELSVPRQDSIAILGLNANTLHAHFYGENDVQAVMGFCSRNGLKMYLGLEQRLKATANPYNQFELYSRWADNITQPWLNGIDSTLDIYENADYFSDDGFKGLYVNHEENLHGNDLQFYHGWDRMISKYRSRDSNPDHKTTMVWGARNLIFPDFTDIVDSLDFFEDETYLFDYYSTMDHFNDEIFQFWIEYLFDTYCNAWENFRDTQTKWMPVIWVAAMADVHSWPSDCGDAEYNTLTRRWPTGSEIRLQAFLALAAGARGIVVFSLSSDELSGYKIWGLLDYDRDPAATKTIPKNHDNWLAAPYNNYFENYGDITPYKYVSDLYADLKKWGPYFMTLWLDQHYGQTSNLPDTSDILRRVTGNYISGSTFTDTSSVDSTRYFMLVNRVTSSCNDYGCPADAQACSVFFKMPASTAYAVRDKFHGKTWAFATPDSLVQGDNYYHFVDTLQPGDGKLYRLNRLFTGPIVDSVTVSEDIILTEDLTINTSGTLVIKPGVNVFIYPDIDESHQGYSDSTVEIICKGKIIAEGTSTDSIRFIPLSNPHSSSWVGIYVDQGATARFDYCSILYGDIGVEGRNNANVRVSHCDISNNTTAGVYNYKGKLKLQNSIVSNNGTYGVFGYIAVDSIAYTKFIDNEVYGIRLEAPNTAHNYSYVGYDTISCSPFPSQYGICIYNNDYVKIEKCKIRTYTLGAIWVYNSDATIKNCDLSSNINYGINSTQTSRPYIRQCLFDNLAIGLKTSDYGSANMGTSADSGKCTFSNISSNFIYHDLGPSGITPDTLKAQYNWYGSAPPDRRKFYAVYPAVIQYNPWLTFAPPPPKLDTDRVLPLQFALNQNYPNPFNPETKISFTLDEQAFTAINIYNIMGQKVNSLVNDYLEPGNHTIVWNGKNRDGAPVSSGVYFYTIQSGDHYSSKKMTILR